MRSPRGTAASHSAAPEACQRIAVIGSGISGLGAASALSGRHHVTVFEKEKHVGGHSHTVDVTWRGGRLPVDTGFIVYNERNYPNLTSLFAHFQVPTRKSEMSFAVSLDDGRLEYGSASYDAVFGQRRNLFNPRFLRLLLEITRFFREAPVVLSQPGDRTMTLGTWLAAAGYRRAFIEDHLLPMAAAIWSCPTMTMLEFPLESFLRFFHNHGLLVLADRPQWRTVVGGSRDYVERLTQSFASRIRTETPAIGIERDARGVSIRTADGACHRFDQVVLATHADQALNLLADASEAERSILGAFRYQRNHGYLHGDSALMPKRRRVWSSWNYLGESDHNGERRVSVTYWMNRLQAIDPACPLFLSLNPWRQPRSALVHRELHYEHPVFDTAALAAQSRLVSIQGARRTWYCGSYHGHGFHEDGLASGLAVAAHLGALAPWRREALMPMAAD